MRNKFTCKKKSITCKNDEYRNQRNAIVLLAEKLANECYGEFPPNDIHVTVEMWGAYWNKCYNDAIQEAVQFYGILK